MALSEFWNAFPSMKERLTGVTGEIEKVWGSSPDAVREDLKPLLLTPGKMLRPAFLLMAASGGPGKTESLYPVAAAIELIHTASLIHDDILDRALTRRGVPTLNSTVGIKKAVLEGDYLLSKAFQLASDSYHPSLAKALNRTMERLCLSEIDQDLGPGRLFIGRERYFERIRGKTAELFGLAMFAGALLGGKTEERAEAFYEAGIRFGLSFQIMDDLLDYNGSTKRMGKKAGTDLREGIPTLPLILALEGKDPLLTSLCRSPLRMLFSSAIYRKIRKGGYLSEAEKLGRKYLDESLVLIGREDSPDSELFRTVIDRLAKRQY